jgi:catechol 2,3-dioxygenase-like lactoylglutathione lyase family enzyme
MTATRTSGERDAVAFRSVNHLALITNDMDATVRFYAGVLGCRLVATIGAPGFRHYFFQIGVHSTVAFFEYRDEQVAEFAKPAGVPDARAIQFDHLSLDVADEEQLLALRNQLKEHDCEVTDVVDHGFIRSIYFTDPSGLALEASFWVKDATGGEVDYSDRSLFADADPVAAVRELASAGGISSTPKTKLS